MLGCQPGRYHGPGNRGGLAATNTHPWSQEAEENAWLQPTPIPMELLAVTNAYFMLMIELPTATPSLAMAAAYAEANVTIRIRSNRYYSSEYRIAIHPTIRPRSDYEVNIRYSPNYYVCEN